MAKKQFTDITVKLCQKECHFKRVTNETLTKFADKAEKEYEEKVKKFVDDVDLLDNKRQSLESKLKVKNQLVEVIQNKTEPSDDELDKVIATLEDIEQLEEELETVKMGLMDLNEKSPVQDYLKKVDDLLAEKVETFLEGITAKEFLKESDPVDTIKARNLEKYYQMAIVGERESKILQEMREDVETFLNSQKELRS